VDKNGTTFINIDGARLDNEEVKKTIEKLHARGQLAGWYAAPCISHRLLAPFMKIEGTDRPISDLILKDFNGEPIHAMDGSNPLDVTHPLWEQHCRKTIQRLVGLGIDYLKIDFLSHASVEGDFYDKSIKTGRQAINRAYEIMASELDPKKIGREIFVDLSIAPIFPYFLGNARRSCCDTFGHFDDVRYALNAVNFGFWTSGTIYNYGDPDHCTMYHSEIDGRPVSTFEEGRSRYNCALISGTVMLLSDNFGPFGDEEIIKGSRERVKAIANIDALNEVGRIGKIFDPLYLRDGTTNIYTLKHEGRDFVAIFNFDKEERTFTYDPNEACQRTKGVACDLNRGTETPYDGLVTVTLPGYDSVIFELK
jgi:hypothetical protein